MLYHSTAPRQERSYPLWMAKPFSWSSRGFRKERAGLPHCCGVFDSHGKVGGRLGELKTFRHFVFYLGLLPGFLAIVTLL